MSNLGTDGILQIIEHKIKWNEFGIKQFVDSKWKLRDENKPFVQKRVMNYNRNIRKNDTN